MVRNKKRGFTLIELLVVIAIIGVLSSVVLASLNSARTKSRDAKRISDIKQLQLALELYYDSVGSYPAAVETTTTAGTATALAALTPTYIANIPVDPQNTATEYYKYVSSPTSGTATSYCVGARLENAPTNNLDLCGATDFAAAAQATHGYRAGP